MLFSQIPTATHATVSQKNCFTDIATVQIKAILPSTNSIHPHKNVFKLYSLCSSENILQRFCISVPAMKVLSIKCLFGENCTSAICKVLH